MPSSGSGNASGLISAGDTPYATLADVKARLVGNIWKGDASSSPTGSEVETWLVQTSQWLDAVLRWKYTVPVIHPTDRLTLNALCSMLVAAQVWNTKGGHDGQVPGNGPQLRKDAMLMLAYNERQGRAYLVLPNTPESDTGEAETGQPEASFTDPDVEGNPPRMFRMGMEW